MGGEHERSMRHKHKMLDMQTKVKREIMASMPAPGELKMQPKAGNTANETDGRLRNRGDGELAYLVCVSVRVRLGAGVSAHHARNVREAVSV